MSARSTQYRLGFTTSSRSHTRATRPSCSGDLTLASAMAGSSVIALARLHLPNRLQSGGVRSGSTSHRRLSLVRFARWSRRRSTEAWAASSCEASYRISSCGSARDRSAAPPRRASGRSAREGAGSEACLWWCERRFGARARRCPERLSTPGHSHMHPHTPTASPVPHPPRIGKPYPD